MKTARFQEGLSQGHTRRYIRHWQGKLCWTATVRRDQRLVAETIWRLLRTADLDFHQTWPKAPIYGQQGFRNHPFALQQRPARFLSLENASVLRCPDRAY
jgi:hypothetical protein